MLYLLSYVSGLYIRNHRLFKQPGTETDRTVQKAFYREIVERVAGIEPASSAWKAEVLPLYHTRHYSRLTANIMALLSKTTTAPYYSTLLMVAGEGFEPSKA